jgi:hypothetical protein
MSTRYDTGDNSLTYSLASNAGKAKYRTVITSL